MGIGLDVAENVITDEINRDPLAIDLLVGKMMLRSAAKDDRGVKLMFLRIRSFAPNSLPVRTILSQMSQKPAG